jgi:hypothetical protein
MAQHDAAAIGGGAEFLHTQERGQAHRFATLQIHTVQVELAAVAAVGDEPEAAAVRAQPRLMHFPLAAGQLPRGTGVHAPGVQVRPATLLRQVPQRAVVGQPAEIVE